MKKQTSLEGKIFLKTVHTILDNNKALDITTINLSGKASFADHMIIASGTSQRHLLALSDYLQSETKEKGHSYVRIEGKENGSDWVLVDLGSIVIHLFRPETRQMYDLESMWSMPSLISKRG